MNKGRALRGISRRKNDSRTCDTSYLKGVSMSMSWIDQHMRNRANKTEGRYGCQNGRRRIRCAHPGLERSAICGGCSRKNCTGSLRANSISGISVISDCECWGLRAFAGELDADAPLKNLDAALYGAKAQGRNRFQVYTAELAAG